MNYFFSLGLVCVTTITTPPAYFHHIIIANFFSLDLFGFYTPIILWNLDVGYDMSFNYRRTIGRRCRGCRSFRLCFFRHRKEEMGECVNELWCSIQNYIPWNYYTTGTLLFTKLKFGCMYLMYSEITYEYSIMQKYYLFEKLKFGFCLIKNSNVTVNLIVQQQVRVIFPW